RRPGARGRGCAGRSRRWVGGSRRASPWHLRRSRQAVGRRVRCSSRHYVRTTGYSIDRRGRERVFGAELLERVASAEVAGWSVLIAAPFVGSFLGILVRRLPDRRPIAWSRSRCEWCGAALSVRDLVPLCSWLATKGRCRYCGHPLGWFYPGIELGAVAVALAAVAVDGGEGAWLDCLLGWWLLALGWIDIRDWLLPDALTLPLVVAGLA